jgi:hypothetical protein
VACSLFTFLHEPGGRPSPSLGLATPDDATGAPVGGLRLWPPVAAPATSLAAPTAVNTDHHVATAAVEEAHAIR